MSKIIFLDIDGVITSARIMPAFNKFDSHAVDYLLWICAKADAKIVISSTWRFRKDAKELFKSTFGNYLHKEWRTPNLNNLSDSKIERGVEVNAWLYHHAEITDYAILDDDSDFLDFQNPHLIQTCSYNGILFEHWVKLREMFGIKVGQESR